MINRIWLLLLSFAGLGMLYELAHGHWEVINQSVDALFDSVRLAVEITIGLIGLLCLWLGVLRIGEHAGLLTHLGRVVEPFFHWLIPELPRKHPAFGQMAFNMAANALGLDNAATPSGLAAMKSLQTLNPSSVQASKAQSLFLVLNASSLTIFPVTIILYRAQMGAAQPADVFLPILMATSASTLVGVLVVAMLLRLPIWQWRVMVTLGAVLLLFVAVYRGLAGLPPSQLAMVSSLLGNGFLLVLLATILLLAVRRRVNAFESFIHGAREGFELAIKILPYLVAMLAVIGLLRASGVLSAIETALAGLCGWLGMDTEFVAAIPTALMKPLSGSGARAMMLDVMNAHGVDSLAARIASIVQGSTETTFYVMALYLGVVRLTRARAALLASLAADLAGIVTAILVGYWFFSA